MPPKKTAAPKAKAAAAAGPQHASYQDMVKEAIVNLKERNGSSRQAIKKYIQANNNLGSTSDASFTNHISKALKSGEENGVFERPKGMNNLSSHLPHFSHESFVAMVHNESSDLELILTYVVIGASGPVKLKKPAAKVAALAKPVAAAAKPKAAEKKAAAPKKTTAAAAKKAAAAPKKAVGRPKKTPAAPAPKAKAAASKPKANASKPRAAPAVVEKPAVVLGKTKSGRVTKSTAPQPKPTVKKAAAKKATPKKKAATPKKATPRATPKKA
ncbi:hypothetical protein BLS_007328 [Venturia inaequalis]|uniref:Histone H1 n=1 Tax=Venturia inaequalis TaxID=5025 RepID=A0A8H3V6Y0_VENIN|nr:hypothetical protein BLS_007328 [Venturia inaequalis]